MHAPDAANPAKQEHYQKIKELRLFKQHQLPLYTKTPHPILILYIDMST
jgi:hypothetical protein